MPSVNAIGYKRLIEIRKRLEPNNVKLQEAFIRIGERLKSTAKLEIRRQRMIDSGNLFNSIDYKFTKNGIEFGSYGVVYAAMNEFGGRITMRQLRAMFAAIKRRGGPPRPPKGVVQGLNWKKRPYVTYAVEKERDYMLDTFRRLVSE